MHALLLLTLLAVTPSPNTLLNKSIVGKAMDRDAAAPALVHAGKPSYGVAGAAQTAGGNVALLGANGLIQITGVTKAATTGDTVTINYLLMSGAAATPVVLTEGDGTAGTFDCDGAATDAACVANFCTTFNANASLTGYLYCNYTAATETAAIVAVEGMVPFITSVVASDPTNFVLTRGTDGCVRIGTTSGGVPVFLTVFGGVTYIELTTCTGGVGPLTVGALVGTTSSFSGAQSNTGTTNIGWTKVSAANQACNTTCTYACVFGQDTAALTYAIVDCADATADVCICAGPN